MKVGTLILLVHAWLLVGSLAAATPMAHVLRIDPRTSIQDGSPIVTAVIDLTETKRISEVTAPCAAARGDDQLSCISDALERPGSLATAHPFPAEHVQLAIRVGEQDRPAELVDFARFGDSHHEPGAGTAWLLLLDADSRMKDALDDAVLVARRFVQSMAPSDQVNLIVLGDRQPLLDSGWLDRAHISSAESLLSKLEKPVRAEGRTRPLLSMVKRSAEDAFVGLSGQRTDGAPLHQAMVLISTGYGGGDPATTGPGATQFSEFLTRGRLSQDNTALPKLPVPIISIWVPPKALAEHEQLAREFMQSLANPSIGGFFTVLRDGQADHAGRIVDTVRARFANMILARFRVSCVAPSATQSFSLLFPGSSPQITGDSSFRDVPVGFDPEQWPLDVDVELTKKDARQRGGIYPGGRMRVFGSFCWDGNVNRPEVYFLPPGERLPQNLGRSAEAAKEVQKRLISLDMRGQTTQASDSFVEFQVPDSAQVLHGEGPHAVVRFVVIDSLLRRTSGLTEATVLQLSGRTRPIPRLWIAGGIGLGVLVVLLVAILLRSARGRLPAATSSLPLRPMGISPYATPGPVSRGPRSEVLVGTRATLEGGPGRFTLLAGTDLRVGQDGTRCAAIVRGAEVAPHHATFRFEQGKLLVRDEDSRSGTWLGANRIPPGEWTELSHDDEVRIGQERLRVSLNRT